MSSLIRVGPPDVTLPEEAEEGTRQMPKWPTECISEKISMQATGCTEGLHFQRYPREIPHEVKGRPWMMNVKGVVYSIPCAEYSSTYVGETGRTLRVRMAEQRRAVKNKDPRKRIAMHVQKNVHTINWQEAKILGSEDNWGKRRILETLVI